MRGIKARMREIGEWLRWLFLWITLPVFFIEMIWVMIQDAKSDEEDDVWGM